MFDECYAKLGCANSTSNDPEEAWRQVTETLIKSSCTISRKSCVAFDLGTLKKINYKERMELAHNLKGLQEYLTEVSSTRTNFIYIFFYFCFCYLPLGFPAANFWPLWRGQRYSPDINLSLFLQLDPKVTASLVVRLGPKLGRALSGFKTGNFAILS